MADNYSEYKILDSLFDQIAIIDRSGVILFVNKAWLQFATMNGGNSDIGQTSVNYFDACAQHPHITDGIKEVLTGKASIFRNEYPCHSPKAEQWFLMQVTPISDSHGDISGAVISHINITEQKEVEIRLKKLAMTDSLSGLYNRRYFNIRLQEEIVRAKKYRSSLALLCIDIDEFKLVNDTYGHDAGDEAIRKLSSILTNRTGKRDVCARLGGDEFVILLPGTDLHALRSLSQSILQEVQACQIKLNEKIVFSITVSIGAVELEMSAYNRKTLLQKADLALYKAKEAGRNQVFVLLD